MKKRLIITLVCGACATMATSLLAADSIQITPSGITFPNGGTQTSAATGVGSSLWSDNSTSIYYNSGNVGIGTNDPGKLLSLVSDYDADLLLKTHTSAIDNNSSIWFSRSRGSSDNVTIVQDGDGLGNIHAFGYDGATYWKAASIGFSVDGVPGVNSMPTKIKFKTTPIGSTTRKTRMVIKNNGNVGIGTTAPARKLHISDAMRLEPTFPPLSPASGDMYYSISDALCVYMAAGWSKLAGTGDCNSGTVTSAGQIWMNRNLGASQVATSSTDSAAYGYLYQWGRGTDGHESRNSATTSTNSSSDSPGHANFITESSYPYDWRVPQNDNLWQGVSGTNNPCPDGFRLPTITEWETELASWSSNNSTGAFASPLRLVMGGNRDDEDGVIYDVGSTGDGDYWSSTVNGSNASALNFGSDWANTNNLHRADGYSVRCIVD